MEKRVVLAIVLCVGVLVGWGWLQRTIWPPPPLPETPAVSPPEPPRAPKDGTPAPPAPAPAPQDPTIPEAPTPPGPVVQPAPAPAPGAAEPKTVHLENERLRATLSSLGGGSIRTLDVWGCAHHPPGDTSVAGDPGVVTAAIEGREGFLGVDLAGGGASGLAATHWDLVSEGGVSRGAIESGDVRVETRLRPSADAAHPYHFELEVTATNLRAKPGAPWMLEVGGPWMPLKPHSVLPEDGVIIAAEGSSCEQLVPAKLAEKLHDEPNHERRSEQGWRYIGVRSDFFLAAVLPLDPLPNETAVGFRAAKARIPINDVPTDVDTAQATLRIPCMAPVAGKSLTWRFLVYAGPDSRDVIGIEGSPYEKLGDAFPNRKFPSSSWGFSFGPIARFLGWLLSHLANSVGLGWGIAVCTLTVLVRGLLFPLSRKTQISMRTHAQKMQRVKPRLDAIKEKYEGNTKKQQEETMKVFREEKMSILPGGCLLAFAQMPVWISLYATLQTTFDMRHAAFLWFPDLTGPDHLLEVPALRNIWGLGGLTDGWFNLLPLLMMVTWYCSAAMQPLPEDPEQRAQAKMMRWIPLAFGVFLYRTAAGLTLYMTLSALWSIGESWLIRKVWLSKINLEPPAPPAKPARR
jgi:YidC/Oxa1 family membrane protein insertase